MAFSNHDLVFDSPTNNFATLNPIFEFNPTLANGIGSQPANLIEGNLKSDTTLEVSSVEANMTFGTNQIWYFECYSYGDTIVGIQATPVASGQYPGVNSTLSAALQSDGTEFHISDTGITYGNNAVVVGVCVNLINNTIQFRTSSLGNVVNLPSAMIGRTDIVPAARSARYSGDYVHFNFGQDPTFGGAKVPTKIYTDANGIGRFFYEPPTGALAICTANLAAATTAPTEYIVDETNQHLLTYNGNVTQSKFTPYATDGYSINFKSDDGIYLADHDDWDLGTSNFTIDAWIYFTSPNNADTDVTHDDNLHTLVARWGNSLSFQFIYDFADNRWEVSKTGQSDTNINDSLSSNVWYYVRFVRDGNTLKYYRGKFGDTALELVYDQAFNFDLGTSTRPLNIGFTEDSNNDGIYYFNGYITDFRYTVGTALTTGVTTIPSAAVDAIDTNTKFLFKSSSKTFVDSSSQSHIVNNKNTSSIESWSPYTPEAVRTGYVYRNPDEHGGGSFYFDGNGDYLTFEDSNNLFSGDFTVECWFYRGGSSAGSHNHLLGNSSDSASGFYWAITDTTSPAGKFQLYFNGAIFDYDYYTPNEIPINSWTHLAISVYGSTAKIYINGIQKASDTNFPTDRTTGIGSTYNIGRGATGGGWSTQYAHGNIADLQITNNAKYTSSDESANIPSSKLSSDANTKFLLQPYKSKITKDILNYASDETGKALTYVGNSSVVNTSPYKDGVIGGFNIPGSSNYISINNSNINIPYNTPGGQTIEFWVKYEDLSSSSHFRTFGNTIGVFSNSTFNFRATPPVFELTVSGNNILVGSVVLNRWYHVAITHDNTDARLFIDGIYLGSISTGSNNPFVGTYYLGGYYGVNNTEWFKGKISDVRIVSGQVLYTATSVGNQDFTPPAYPLLSDKYTIDGSDPASGTTITGTTVFLAQPGRFIENTAEADNTDNFKVVTYTGIYPTANSVNVGFNPDLIWLKSKTQTYPHGVLDTIRIVNGYELLSTNNANAQPTSGDLVSFITNGFRVDTGQSFNDAEQGDNNMVAWCWKAGGAPSADDKAMVDGVESTITGDAKLDAGTITPIRMSVNTKAGFSIVQWIGNQQANATIPHGLNAVPRLIILKCTEVTGMHWAVYHPDTGGIDNGHLNAHIINGTDQATASGIYWSNTAPTSSVFTTGTDAVTGYTGKKFIGYIWSEVEGYSKFGSYTGNNSADGPFVYCGFRPAFVIIKRYNASGYNWMMYDSSRNTYNPVNEKLYTNTFTNTITASDLDIDFLSNGFKVRGNSLGLNSTGSFIFMAFSEQPFIYSNAR